MAFSYKVLAQVKPGATTLTTAYTVPSVTQAIISSIVVTNQSGTATAFRISIAVAGLADTAKQYIAYDLPIEGNETIVFMLGISLGAGDIIRVYNTLATLSFNIFGVQVS